MEGVTSDFYEGVNSYWKRRGYIKLNRGNRNRRESPAAADGYSPRRRSWRIKLTPRLKLKFRRFSLKKLLIKLRDGYMNMMMKLANSRFISVGGGGFGGYVGDGVAGFGARPMKEYDEKMIIQIYKSLVLAQGNGPLQDASKVGSLHVTSSAGGRGNSIPGSPYTHLPLDLCHVCKKTKDPTVGAGKESAG